MSGLADRTATVTTASCVSCARGWRHCHGTWVTHVDGGECTDDPDCSAPPEAHDHVVACADVGPGCC